MPKEPTPAEKPFEFEIECGAEARIAFKLTREDLAHDPNLHLQAAARTGDREALGGALHTTMREMVKLNGTQPVSVGAQRVAHHSDLRDPVDPIPGPGEGWRKASGGFQAARPC